MTSTDTPTGQHPAVDPVQQLFDQLGRDAEDVIRPINDGRLYKLGSVLSALALNTPAGTWDAVRVTNHPGQSSDPEVGDLPDVEVYASSPEAAVAIVGALHWPHPAITRREVWSESGRVHVVTRGVLFDSVRVAIVALESAGGAA